MLEWYDNAVVVDRRLVVSFRIYLLALLGFAVSAVAQPHQEMQGKAYKIAPEHTRLESMTLEHLNGTLSSSILLRDMKRAKFDIENGAECSPSLRDARDTLSQLKSLNQQYRNKATATYQARAQELKSRNANALQQYKTCFARKMVGYERIAASSINSYDRFRTTFKSFDGDPMYEQVTTLDEFIRDLQSVIASKVPGAAIASVLALYGDIKVSPDGETQWRVLKKGDPLPNGYHIRSGSNSRARIQFHDYIPGEKRGPTILNLAPRSVVKLTVSSRGSHKPILDRTIDLLRGTIRAFIKRSAGAHFSVRTSTSICGIRGTEVGVVHNPDTGITDYHLDHGDAYLEVNGRQTPLQPKTSVRVQNNGQVSAAQPTPAGFWDNLVSISGSGQPETGEVEAEVAANDGAIDWSENLSSTDGTVKDNAKYRPNDGAKRYPDPTPREEHQTPPNERVSDASRDAAFAELSAFGKSLRAQQTPESRIELRTMEAESTANDLMAAVKDGLGIRALIHMQGELARTFESRLRRKSLYELQDEAAGRLVRYQKRCQVCNADATKCGVIFDVVSERQNDRWPYPILLELAPSTEIERMQATAMVEPTGEQLDWYAAKSRLCR